MYTKKTNANELPKDESLTSEEILEMHNRLVDLANELVANSIRAMNELTESQEMDPDELDVAISESNRELSLRFADRERRMLKKIQHSLERISEGEYGECEECGVAIGIRRLRFRPVACLCIDCKTEQEQLERNSWSM
jgi:DnaK suppressor protein